MFPVTVHSRENIHVHGCMQCLQSAESSAIETLTAGVVELVDASDSKSDERKLVGVQVPSPAPCFY